MISFFFLLSTDSVDPDILYLYTIQFLTVKSFRFQFTSETFETLFKQCFFRLQPVHTQIDDLSPASIVSAAAVICCWRNTGKEIGLTSIRAFKLFKIKYFMEHLKYLLSTSVSTHPRLSSETRVNIVVMYWHEISLLTVSN